MLSSSPLPLWVNGGPPGTPQSSHPVPHSQPPRTSELLPSPSAFQGLSSFKQRAAEPKVKEQRPESHALEGSRFTDKKIVESRDHKDEQEPADHVRMTFVGPRRIRSVGCVYTRVGAQNCAVRLRERWVSIGSGCACTHPVTYTHTHVSAYTHPRPRKRRNRRTVWGVMNV